MNEQQLREIEKYLGRRLTPEEKRLLRYTEGPRPAAATPPPRKPKKASQAG